MFIINVDDDSDDREIFLEAIKAIDPQIAFMPFTSCKEAMDYLKSASILPDYVFLDINMPKMNGYDCIKSLSGSFDFAKMNVVMFSTAFHPADQIAFDRIGVKYLVKSTTLTGLINNLKKVINVLEGEPKV